MREHECQGYIVALLKDIKDQMDILYWNKHQKEYDDSPFVNSGNVEGYNDGVFEVHAYDWGDEDQKFNFKYKDIEIS